MGSVYRVVKVKSEQEMNRFTNLADASVLWVKYPGERRVEEVGTNDVIRRTVSIVHIVHAPQPRFSTWSPAANADRAPVRKVCRLVTSDKFGD